MAEAAVQMECKIDGYHEFKNETGKLTATMVIARVVLFHINQHVYDANSGTVKVPF